VATISKRVFATAHKYWRARIVLSFLTIATAAIAVNARPSETHVKPPAPNAALLALGHALFESTALSADGNVSCKSCHDPQRAYSDGKRVSTAESHRNTPSLLALKHYSRFGWDGHARPLDKQVLEPLFSSREHGFRNPRELVVRVRDTPALAQRYRDALGESAPFIAENIARALTHYVEDISARHEITHQAIEPTGAAARGRVLFAGRAGCGACHVPERGFTDNRVHINHTGRVSIDDAATRAMNRARLRTEAGAYQRAAMDVDAARLGAFNATHNPADLGKVRTPSLVAVAQTAPYMHDGSVASLREAIEREAALRGPAQLPGDDIDALLAYLNTLP
jgi:cytochrome c peroxidase